MSIPNTVCCLLCRGTILYKNGDKTRFKAHMNNEHGAFFDHDFLLASCMMEAEQKETVARTVKTFYQNNAYHHDIVPGPETNLDGYQGGLGDHHHQGVGGYLPQEQETLQENVSTAAPDQELETSAKINKGIKRERTEHTEAEMSSSGSSSRHHKTKTTAETGSAAKRRPKTISCPDCNKGFVSEQSYKIHADKFHKKEEPAATSIEDALANDDAKDDDTSGAGGDTTKPAEESTYYTDDNSSFQSLESQQDMSSLNTTESSQFQDATNTVEDPASSAADDKTGNKTAAAERFLCQFEGCGKSYTNSSNRLTHQRKAHGLLGPRAAKKQQRNSVADDEDASASTTTPGAVSPQEPGHEVMETEPSVSSSSFLTDTSLGLDDETEEGVFTNDDSTAVAKDIIHEIVPVIDVDASDAAKKETDEIVDISSSAYFVKNPKVIATARGKSLGWFDDLPAGSDLLPSGWKQRSLEATNNKTGEKTLIKHYLSPEQKVLKTGLAVVEYLRIKGGMEKEELVKIAEKLNVPEKKFKSLFDQ